MKQSKKAISKKQKLKKTLFKLEELEALSSLLNAGLSINDGLSLIKDKYNRKLIEELEFKLNNGELIEKIFGNYLNKRYRQYFESFITYLSFSDSLSLMISIKNKENQNRNKTIKELTYPIMLLIGVIVAIVLFNFLCFDSLIDTMRVFKSDMDYLIIYKNVIDIMVRLILFIALVLFMIIFYFTRKKRIVFAYILLQRYCPRSMIKEYLSSCFITYFLECLKLGIKTKDSMQILKSFKHQPLISFIAYHVDDAFLEGKDMQEALKNPYLDSRLSRFIKIAIYANDVERMLVTYLDNFDKRFSRYCHNLSKMIQLFSYAVIAVVIIFIYQILFIPMGIIGGF